MDYYQYKQLSGVSIELFLLSRSTLREIMLHIWIAHHWHEMQCEPRCLVLLLCKVQRHFWKC